MFDTGQKLLTVTEVAEILSLGKTTVQDYARAGKIPSVKMGTNVRFIPADVEGFVLKNRRPKIKPD